jgi:hypothetical protein
MKTLIFAALALQVVSFSKNVEETARSDDFLSRTAVTVDGKQYRFEINGGSFGVLLGTSPSGASYYGCKKRCAKLFPFQVYDDE